MVIKWIIFGIFVILILVFLKLEHTTKRYKIITLLILAVLFYFSALKVMGSADVNLSSPKGIGQAVYIYVGWIGRSVSNLWESRNDMGKIVGNAININNTKKKK